MNIAIGFLIFVVGYFAGRWHWKRIADDAAALAGRAILLCHQIQEEKEKAE